MPNNIIPHPAETGRRKSASLRSFHERARIAIAQVELLKELILNDREILDQMSSDDLDMFLDAVEDPGSIKSKRSKGSNG